MQTHAKDERVGVDSYYRGVEFYDRFIESFALGKQ
jgi:acetylornithine deacetylase/succinyl-diaminopimelate desuccinylase-like protein